jgi:sorbitol-specific phosphotransferase system component IIC
MVYVTTFLIQTFATSITTNKDFILYLTADYIPPFLPFMLGTASFGLILISVFIFIGNKIGETKIGKILTSTGQMTLTHYIVHLVLGFLLLSMITGKTLSYDLLKLEERFKDNAEWYSQRITNYLLENSTLYPLYLSPGNGIDTIIPKKTMYSSGMYLGSTINKNLPFSDRFQGNIDSNCLD